MCLVLSSLLAVDPIFPVVCPVLCSLLVADLAEAGCLQNAIPDQPLAGQCSLAGPDHRPRLTE